MKKALVAVLDWGLGHATRCIPIIRELERQGCSVLIAGSGQSLQLLKEEFPHLTFFNLPAYAPRYSLNKSMVLKMIRQLPKFYSVVRREHLEIENIVKKHGVQMVISDNRYGCWSGSVPSFIITHQSNVLMPRKFGFLQGIVRRIVESKIQKFKHCWIPDYPDRRFSGELSMIRNAEHTSVEFIGPLSRFTSSVDTIKKYDVVAICSGPEPQRTLLEKNIHEQLKNSGVSYFLVRGLIEPSNIAQDLQHVRNFMTSDQLGKLIASAEVVIARSGYSTIMDLAFLKKKAILIPTPGQTEQEYLAASLRSKGIFYSVTQDTFDLTQALKESATYTGFKDSYDNQLLTEVIARHLK
jgi:uncharacterized protein (TIGR00661 family)